MSEAAFGLFGSTRMPSGLVFGATSARSSSRFVTSLLTRKVTPVMFSARPIETRDEAQLDRIRTKRKDDWNARCCGLRGDCRRRGSGHYQVYTSADQLGRQCRQKIIAAFGKAKVEYHVLTFDEARFLQPPAKRLELGGFRVGRLHVEHTDHRSVRLLRLDGEWRGESASAYDGDERSPVNY